MRELKFNVFTDFGMFKNVSIHSTREFGISHETFFKTAKKPIGREEDDWDELLSEFNFVECGEDWMQGEGIIVQYTGLRDKSGVEIYEGDIVKHLDRFSHLVFYKYGAFGYEGSMKDDFISYQQNGFNLGLKDTMLCKVEIIGNIHLNPNLL